MNYILFKEMVAKEILNYMPGKFANYEVLIKPVNRVNRTLDGITLMPSGDDAYKVAPTLFLNYMYDHYLDCDDMSEVLRTAADTMVRGFEEKSNIIDLSQPIVDPEKIIMTLVNSEQNKRLLATVPYKEFYDLSIIYRCIAKMDENGIGSFLITHEMLNKLDLSEDDLYRLAVDNTRRLLPPVVRSMQDVIRDMILADGTPAEIVDMMICNVPDEKQMYVITNSKGINGSVSILFEDLFFELADKLNSDLYILPSSIHEVIAIPASDCNPENLADMVSEVNVTQVNISERLSNQVYYYSRSGRKLIKATNTPNKRLD